MGNQVVKKLGAFVMAATFAVGMLVTSVQPSDAATTNFQVKKVSYSKEYKMDDGSVYFSMKGKFPTITDDSKAARKINQVLEKEKNRLIHQYDKELTDFKKEYKSQVAYDKENGYDFTWSYGDEVQCKVTANNEKYFCVMLSGYTYEGGAHGNPYRSCLTFDSETGKKLTAANVFGISKKQLNNKVHKLYLAKFDKNDPNVGFYPVSRKEFKKDLESMNFNNDFYVRDNGKAIFYADPYALGPYAAGYIQVSAVIK